MAFANEYITEADRQRYGLQKVCGDHNLPNRGHMHSQTWTIDRELDAFLIPIWSHRDAQFNGWAFYWKGTWVFFEMRGDGVEYDNARDRLSFRAVVRALEMPQISQRERSDLIEHLKRSIVSSMGGTSHKYSSVSGEIGFE